MVKNYFFNLLLTLANLLFPLLSFPYVSRVLGPEGIGQAQFAFSFAQYFSLIAGLGIPIYGIKEIARHKQDVEARSVVFCELITIYFITSICMSVIYLIVIYNVPYFAANRPVYLSAIILIFFSFCYIEWLYSGMEQFKSIALRSIAFKFVNLGLLYLFVRERNDFGIYLFLLMFAFVGNNVLSFFLIGDKIRLHFKNLNLKRHMAPLFFILGTTLAAGMYAEMDTVLLGFLSDSKTVGLYTAAVKLSKIAIPFVTSMGVILIPKAGQDFADNNLQAVQQTLNQTFSFLVFFGVPVAVGLTVLAPEFIALFSGSEFLPAVSAMQLLSWLPLIIGFAHLLVYQIMVPAGKNRQMFLCVLAGLCVSLLINFTLVPLYRQVGSAVANIASEVVVTALYMYVISKYFKFKYQWSLLLSAGASALLFLPVIWLIRQLAIPLPVTVLAALTGCAGVYLLTQTYVFKSRFVFDIIGFVKTKLSQTSQA